MIYRTDDASRWGIGKGSNLAPAEIDGNFWELASRLVAVEGAAGSAANGIQTITVTGSQMTVWLEDGTALGPHTLPTAMIRYRGDWAAGAAYAELDLVSVPQVGLYLVLRDHTAVAPFDANARDAENTLLYRWLMPMAAPGGTSLGQLNDVDLSVAPADGETLVHSGGAWYPGLPSMGLGDLAGVFPGTPADGDVLAWVAADSAWRAVAPAGGGGGGAAALGELSDVTLAGPADGQFLGHDGTAWVNVTVGWTDLSGMPATIAALPAALGTAGQVLKVQGDGSVAWDTDDNSGGGGGGGGAGASYTLPDIAPPEAAWFATAIGSPTVSQDTGGLRYDGAAASAQVRATFKTLPAADTVITVKVDPTTRFESNFNGGGVLLRDSASGRYLLVGIMSVSNKPWTEMGEWSSATAFSAPTAGSSRKWDGAFPTWFRASYVHATGAITGAWSFDGETWVTMGTSSWLAAPDQSGIGLVCRNAADPASIRFTFYDDGTQIGERVTIGGEGPAPIEDIAGTTYVQVAGDAGKFKRTTSADAVTITIAADVNAAGDEITFCQSGAGLVTFAAGAGMTLLSRGGALASAGQHAVMGVKFITGSQAVLFGDIA